MVKALISFFALLFIPCQIHAYSIYEDDPWGYKDDNGPEKWGDINPEYKKCKQGAMQSPIDINKTKAAPNQKSLNLGYKTVPMYIQNDGRHINIQFPKGSYLFIGGKPYHLIRCEFHTPSEHKVDGKIFPMEIQFIHENAEGKLAVISLHVKEGDFNVTLQSVINNMPAEKSYLERVKSSYVNATDFFPKSLSHYNYQGSLTKPPCTEGIDWYVLDEPISAGKKQLDAFKKVTGDNFRPVQALNDREILKVRG